jgi:hypothetical protein
MKLAIAVVYLVADSDDEKLLELHLEQIEKNTAVPYTIYAAANRLPEQLRLKLERHPKVKICNPPTTELRGSAEHSFYLELLVAAAIEDGATHVCTLHMDSFPVRPGWATELAARLRGDCVLAGLLRDGRYDRKPLTAFMMFTREFYLGCRPTFQLPAEILASSEYRRYAEACRHLRDSGVGYGFKIFSEGLSWYPLARSDKGPDGWGFGIFGDMVFHLGGAIWAPQKKDAARTPLQNQTAFWLERFWRFTRSVLPGGLRVQIGRLAPRAVLRDVDALRVRERKARLVVDPDAFLQRLRGSRW